MVTSVKTLISKDNHIYDGCTDDFLNYKIVSGDFFEEKESGVLMYKNCVEVTDLKMLSKKLPRLAALIGNHNDSIPLLCSQIESIEAALEAGEPIAIEGGPCLFGENEVMINMVLVDGETYSFDYSSGKSYLKEYDYCVTSNDLAGFVEEHAKEIKDITFVNHKEKITSAEYDSIRCLFEVADALGAVVVIPLPDMSYIKFLKGMLDKIEGFEYYDRVMNEFKEIAFHISDIYIHSINRIAVKYKNIEYCIVHERDSSLCEKYYEGREKHIERNRVLREITSVEEKVESVKDYISMPALPYYIYGIKTIIEIDCLDETDSYRKCRKAHKGTINLGCILYPERLSKDDKNTIFHTTREYKEYMDVN